MLFILNPRLLQYSVIALDQLDQLGWNLGKGIQFWKDICLVIAIMFTFDWSNHMKNTNADIYEKNIFFNAIHIPFYWFFSQPE